MSKPKGGTVIVSFASKKTKDKDGHVDLTYSEKAFSKSGVKRYHECLMMLAGVTGVARDFMDYITMQMDTNNGVSINWKFKENFMAYMMNCENKRFENNISEPKINVPKANTLKNAVRVLVNRGMLISDKKRGYFMVNPEYFMKPQNEKNRGLLLKIILEFKYGIRTKLTVKRELDEENYNL